jgi:Transglutaminase-like superfamily
VLEATVANRVFQIVPAQALSDNAFSSYNPSRRTDAEGSMAPRHKRYAAATPAIWGGRQLHAVPNPNRVSTIAEGMAFYEEEEQAMAFDASRFPRLTEIAAGVLAQQKLEDAKPLDKALALERHFLSPGVYQYSLNLNFTRDPALDPVEDFVANHRTGHCEYFASALVLMLRSQGIPARMIVGYKGGSFNSVGQYYVVQQRNAHTWVEVLIPTDGVPKGEIAGPTSDGGAWYRLDPTPGRELFVSQDEQGLGSRAAQAFDYVELLWRDYVLSLNNNRQEDIIYKPLQAQAGMLPSWVESRGMRNLLRRMSMSLGFDFPRGQQRGGRRAFEASLAILVIGGLLGLAGFVQAMRIAGNAIGHWLKAGKNRLSSRSPAFYRRTNAERAGNGGGRAAGDCRGASGGGGSAGGDCGGVLSRPFRRRPSGQE